MGTKRLSLSGMYYRYKKTSDEEIRNYMANVGIVILEKKNKGKRKFYPLTNESIRKIYDKPRDVSLSFDACQTGDVPINGLVEYKTIKYLVKSTSRFFLKPDIGEIFDQIDFHDLHGLKFDCIQFYTKGYKTLPETDGEHFILEAKLLKLKDEKPD